MESDLFGHTDCAHSHTGQVRPDRVDVFDLAGDLSEGERYIVADYISRQAPIFAERGLHKTAERLTSEAERYAYCGNQVVGLSCPECRSKYFIKMLCRSRICERCGRIYKKELQKKMVPMITDVASNKRKGYTLALVTLTVSSKRFGGELPTREHIERLYDETSTFLRLNYGKHKSKLSKSGKVVEVRRKLSASEKAERKRLRTEAKARGDDPPKFDNKSQRVFIGAGWIATLEIGSDNNNAHCHAIVYGPIRQWHKLRQFWEKITGDSRGVDIRKIRNPQELTNYVLKYITKPPVTESYSRVADYAIMIKGTRRLRSGGIFYNAFTPDRPEKPKCKCAICGNHLVMDGAFMKEDCADRGDLYDLLREIVKLGVKYQSPLNWPENSLPQGVTPVNLPLWPDLC